MEFLFGGGEIMREIWNLFSWIDSFHKETVSLSVVNGDKYELCLPPDGNQPRPWVRMLETLPA